MASLLARSRVFFLTAAVLLVPVSAVAATSASRAFAEDASISRGSFIREAVKALGLPTPRVAANEVPYRRVPAGLRSVVGAAEKKGALVIFGDDLKLSQSITRGEALSVLFHLTGGRTNGAFSSFTDVRNGSEMERGVMNAIEKGWMEPKEEKRFGVDDPLTGREANLLLRKIRGDHLPASQKTKTTEDATATPTIRVNLVGQAKRTAPLPKSQMLEALWQLINEEYLYSDKINPDDVAYAAAEAIMKSLNDPYTTFLRPVSAKNFQNQLKGEVTGIGAQVEQKDGVLTIVTPLRGSPAETAGLKPGDQILSVNGTSLAGKGFLEAVEFVRGARGSIAELTVRRDGQELKFKVTRDTIKVPEVEVSWQGSIAVIHLMQFGEVTLRDLRGALQKVQEQKPEGLILDLRNNPGGLLDAATIVVGNFMPSGTIVTKIEARGTERIERTGDQPTINSDLPVVVLVNEGSASASEIVAAALKDHKRATIVGKKTFGKGTVQQVLQFNDLSSVKMTVAEYFSPNGVKVDGIGVMPDVIVENTTRDDQLLKAVEIIQAKHRGY